MGLAGMPDTPAGLRCVRNGLVRCMILPLTAVVWRAGEGGMGRVDRADAILARLLGIHISVAVAWQRAAVGDWAAYAAQVSRRAR